VQEKRRISDGTQKREPTWEAAHDKSGIGVQAGGRFWHRDRRGCAPTRNINLWGFEDIDQKLVQLVNNVPLFVPLIRPLILTLLTRSVAATARLGPGKVYIIIARQTWKKLQQQNGNLPPPVVESAGTGPEGDAPLVLVQIAGS
jgi:hypothetical protein